ncbi:MAG: GAP family protein [Leucobacter sp.]
MDLLHAALMESGYGAITAFHTLPILTVIALLLSVRKVSVGIWFAAGYVLGLALVFGLAMFGVKQFFSLRGFDPSWYLDIAAGLVLIVSAIAWWCWRRKRPTARTHRLASLLSTLQRMGPLGAALIGLQFAFHPDCLLLVVAAAGHTAQLSTLAKAGLALWFALLGSSTVIGVTLFYARAGVRAHTRLRILRIWIRNNAARIGFYLVLSIGAALIALGSWQLARR